MNWRDIPFQELELSVRSANALGQTGRFPTLGAIADASDAELLRTPNFGRVSLWEVREVVRSYRPNGENEEVISWALAHRDVLKALMTGQAVLMVPR